MRRSADVLSPMVFCLLVITTEITVATPEWISPRHKEEAGEAEEAVMWPHRHFSNVITYVHTTNSL